MNKNETLFNEMEQAYMECGEHCRRVADLVLAFCNFLNIDKDATGDIHTAALFHDIGKLSVPETICENQVRFLPTNGLLWSSMHTSVPHISKAEASPKRYVV